MSTPTFTMVGFYYENKSLDIPNGSSFKSKFGFTVADAVNPIFDYSISDVFSFLIKPHSLVNGYNNLVIENMFESDEYIANITDFDTSGINALTNKLSQINLDHSKTDLEISRILDTLPNYTAGSLAVHRSLYIPNRISKLNFQYKILDNNYSMTIYLTPDDLIFYNWNKIGYYDITHDENNYTVSTTSLSNLMNDPIDSPFKFESDRNYTNISKFNTTYRHHEGTTFVYSYVRTFFIYCHLSDKYQPLDQQKISAIKGYLTDKYLLLYGIVANQYLVRDYPDLFTVGDVNIFPAYFVNNDGTIGSLSSNILSISNIMNILDLDDNEILTVGDNIDVFNIECANSKDDIFNITSKADKNILFPFVAHSDIVTHPIQTLFPNYNNRFTGAKSDSVVWESFSFHIKLFVKYLIGVNDWVDFVYMNDDEISKALNLNPSLNFRVDRVRDGNIDIISSIKFDMLGMTFVLHAYKRG